MLNATEIMELQKLAGMENFKKLTIPQFLARETLIELICSTEYGNGSLMGNNFQKGFIEKIADHLIDNDVVPVVRCKDCRDCEMCYPEKLLEKEATQAWLCKRYKRYRKQDDFCSYGEKKGE